MFIWFLFGVLCAETQRFINLPVLSFSMGEMESRLRIFKKSLFMESLPYIFTDWQIKIIKKRLNKERLTNSEKVEFSCNIKKKIIAIQLLKDLNLILF